MFEVFNVWHRVFNVWGLKLRNVNLITSDRVFLHAPNAMHLCTYKEVNLCSLRNTFQMKKKVIRIILTTFVEMFVGIRYIK